MQHFLRSRSSTSAPKSISAATICTWCLFVGGGGSGMGSGLWTTTEKQKDVTKTTNNTRIEKQDEGNNTRAIARWALRAGKRERNPRDVTGPKTIGRQVQPVLNKRLGEFYARFYSTMSEAAITAMGDGGSEGDHKSQEKRERFQRSQDLQHRSSGIIVPTSISHGKTTEPGDRNFSKEFIDKSQQREGSGGKQKGLEGKPHRQGDAKKKDDGLAYSSVNAPSLINLHNPSSIAPRYPLRRTRSRERDKSSIPSVRRVRLDPLRATDSSVVMINNMLEHERLGRELRIIIAQKLNEQGGLDEEAWDPNAGQPSPSYVIEMMKNTLRYINKQSIKHTGDVVAAVKGFDPPSPLTASMHNYQRTYIPPFPNYYSRRPPVLLNTSLKSLMSERPVPRNIVLKVCYNLLTSPSAPDTVTYNILVHNFVLLRQNVLAEVVFREMIKAGGLPDDYTIVALLNLMVKSGDYDGWLKIAALQKKEDDKWKNNRSRRRSKHLVETLIIHSAHFGSRKYIRRYMRVLKTYCPNDPEPGVNVWTALIRFYGESREYLNGMRCWHKILEIERAAIEKKRTKLAASGQPTNGPIEVNVIDERCVYWWLWLCERCNRRLTLERWKNIARGKGIDVDKLLYRAPDKAKGLNIRPGNKSPPLGQHEFIGDWWKELQKQRHIPQDSVTISATDREIFRKKLTQIIFGPHEPAEWKSDETTPTQNNSNTPRHTSSYRTVDWDSLSEIIQRPKPEAPPPSSNPGYPSPSTSPTSTSISETPLVSGAVQSQIWQNILIRRLDILLNRHEAQLVKEARGEIYISEEERRRGAVLEKWKREWRDKDPAEGDIVREGGVVMVDGDAGGKGEREEKEKKMKDEAMEGIAGGLRIRRLYNTTNACK